MGHFDYYGLIFWPRVVAGAQDASVGIAWSEGSAVSYTVAAETSVNVTIAAEGEGVKR